MAGKREQPKPQSAAEEKAAKRKRLKLPKLNKMDVILLAMFLYLIYFVEKMLNLYMTTGGVPDTVVAGVFALIAGEYSVMGSIKKQKERLEDRKWQREDRKHEREMMELAAKQQAGEFSDNP